MLGKSGSDGVGEAGSNADDRIGVFDCLTRLRRAGDTAIGADKAGCCSSNNPFPISIVAQAIGVFATHIRSVSCRP